MERTSISISDPVDKDAKTILVEGAASDEIQEDAFVQSPEERRLVRKLDMRILPLACLMYLFACAFAYIMAIPELD